MKKIFDSLTKRRTLETSPLLENQSLILDFTYDGGSTVNTRNNNSEVSIVKINGKQENGISVLKDCLEQGYKPSSLAFKNTWLEVDKDKDRPLSRALLIANEILNPLVMDNKLNELRNLEMSGYNLSLNKSDGNPRKVSPLNSVVNVIRNSQNLESLNLQNNKLDVFSVRSLLAQVRGSEGSKAISVDSFSNQTTNQEAQEEINNLVSRFVEENRSQLEAKMSSGYINEDSKTSHHEVKSTPSATIENPLSINLIDREITEKGSSEFLR